MALITALAAGIVLGLFYFGGLWWTTRRLLTASNPILLSLGSFFIRTTMVLAGLYLVMAGDWLRLTASLAGMIMVRLVMRSCIGL